ncbi:hypothetical protein HA72_1232 [Metallosphaera sedula]|uniref:Uncharacterized protein n=6 Tax=Sulfolobaceae TaxID=118883 RepID=A4YG41_METS5|nr:hypothetical protein Msed_1232 [Metallosphaera sedula DSM 5348]AIM27378.1 hypothetical protein HA72_1232 [Metallosphaera sedula]QCO29094.1 hypothetical protein DFR88_00195 [Metallosphaera prunae]AKV74258.1 hypothetical protein MsedA_1252 [Metallosphaera sedula]AKV76497.1 hypothetical protein MsedB_1254 [Metallosphaera sedula]
MSSLTDIVTAIVPGLIGLVASLLQYYIPVFSERKSQRIRILKLISVEYNTVDRYMSLVQESRIYYYGFLILSYLLLTIIGYISIIFKQYDRYINLFVFIILSLIVLFLILVRLYLRSNKDQVSPQNTTIKSTNLDMKRGWQVVSDAMFFLYWKSIRNISLMISSIFLSFLIINVLIKGPASFTAFALSSTLSGSTVIMTLYVMRIRFYFTERTIKGKYSNVKFPKSNSEGEMESEFFKIINDKPKICIEDSKGEICGKLNGIKYGIEINNANGVYIIPFTEILRIRKPPESHVQKDCIEPF